MEKQSLSLKLLSGDFYGQSFIKTVRGPLGLQMDRLPVQASPEELCSEREACLSGVGTYLPGTVGQGCRWFQAVLELTSQAPWGSAGCLSGVRNYLSGTVVQG